MTWNILKTRVFKYNDSIIAHELLYKRGLLSKDIAQIILNNYDGWIHTDPTDYYNTGTMRIVEYYPNLDIYKMKANWHINSCILSV